MLACTHTHAAGNMVRELLAARLADHGPGGASKGRTPEIISMDPKRTTQRLVSRTYPPMPFFTSFLFCLLFTASAHAGFMYAFVSFPSLSLYLDETLEQPRTRREEGEAGPSTPYRRSLRLGDSTTSFLDVSDSISDISEYPVSGGGYCDVHTAFMTGEGVVALKRLRLFGNVEKALKVSAHPLKKSLLEVTHPPP